MTKTNRGGVAPKGAARLKAKRRLQNGSLPEWNTKFVHIWRDKPAQWYI